jgi:hypothetical protein
VRDQIFRRSSGGRRVKRGNVDGDDAGPDEGCCLDLDSEVGIEFGYDSEGHGGASLPTKQVAGKLYDRAIVQVRRAMSDYMQTRRETQDVRQCSEKPENLGQPFAGSRQTYRICRLDFRINTLSLGSLITRFFRMTYWHQGIRTDRDRGSSSLASQSCGGLGMSRRGM